MKWFRRFRKLLKYIIILLLLLLVIVAVALYYFLYTENGLKRGVELANRYSGYHVSIDQIKGTLFDGMHLKQVLVEGDGLKIDSKEIVLGWKSGALWDKKLEINKLEVLDTVVTLPPAAPEQPAESEAPMALSDIELPFKIKLEDIHVANLTLKTNDNPENDIVIDEFRVGIDYANQQATIHQLVFQGMGANLTGNGNIQTRGDFPLSLKTAAQYQSPQHGTEDVNLSLDGALKKRLNLNVAGKGIGDFSLTGEVSDLFKAPQFDVNLVLERFDGQGLGLVDTKAKANLAIAGQYNIKTSAVNVNTQGDVFYTSPETDAVKATLTASFDGDQADIPALTIDLLTAQELLVGKAAFTVSTQALDVSLKSPALHWPQAETKPPARLRDFQVAVTGTLADYRIAVDTLADTEAVGEVPLTLKAAGNLTSMQDIKAQIKVNHQPLTLTGKAAWQPAIDYDINVVADAIAPFKAFPGIKSLNLDVTGDDKRYNVNGGGHVYSDSIAPTDIMLSVKGSPTHLDNADLQLKTLGGQATVSASGDLTPLDMKASLATQHIQPQRFYPGIDADINSQIDVTAKQSDDNLIATVDIKELSGNLQKYPLAGQGNIVYDQLKGLLDIDGVAVTLAGNDIKANGQLALDVQQGQSNVVANINAKHLQRLLPDLKGAILADITLKGNVEHPELTAKINGKNLAYQAHRVKKFIADADISLANDRLNIKTDVAGLQSGDNRITSAKVDISGKISDHLLAANIQTPPKGTIPSVAMQGKGGLNIDQQSWAGTLKKLSINSALAGRWVMPQASQLKLSANDIAVKTFCLQQQTAKLCADGQMQSQTGQFNVKLTNLKTAAFAKFIPKAIDLKTTINGQANIQLNQGQPTVKGKLATQGGRLRISTGKQTLVSNIKQFETKMALKNNRAEATVSAKLSGLADVDVKAMVADINKPAIRAELKLSSKDLKYIEKFAPQISDIKGQLIGNMSFSGNPSKQLNVKGKIGLQNTQFNVPQFGTQIRALNLDIFANNSQTINFKGGAKAGKGQLSIGGKLNPLSQKGQITIQGESFQVANSKKLQVAISPNLKILFTDTIKVRGDITIPKALIVPEGGSGSKITASDDVVLPKSKAKKKKANSPVDAEIGIKLGDDVRVASADIEMRLFGGIKVFAKPNKAPAANGTISIQTGELQIYGQRLNIERGRVIFTRTSPIANPSLDIRASRNVDEYDVTVGANVLGTAQTPKISLFSRPGMSDSSILSYLLFGRPPSANTFNSTAILQTTGLVGANTLARDIRSSIGLDVLNFSLTEMEAGKNLTKKIYIGVKSNIFDSVNAFLTTFRFSKTLRLEGKFNSNSDVSVDLIKILETD